VRIAEANVLNAGGLARDDYASHQGYRDPKYIAKHVVIPCKIALVAKQL
jgi:hypothetical protein